MISDLEQIRALADPFRQRLLGEFAKEVSTAKQVATRIGQPPTKLYHHVALLEKVGLLVLVETRPKRGTVEKYYGAVARRFSVASSSLELEGVSLVESVFSDAFAKASSAIRSAVECGKLQDQSSAMLAMGRVSLSKEKLEELRHRVTDLLTEYKSEGTEPGDRSTFGLLFTVYPLSE